MADLFSLGMIVVPDGIFTTIQSAINFAAQNPHQCVFIKSSYNGTDSYVNPAGVPIFDMRFPGSISFGGGGGSTPGGSNTQIQFNNGGVFGGSSRFTFDPVTNIVLVNTVEQLKREQVIGTALSSGNFALTGWGSGATVTAISGFDGAHTFLVTAGTGPTIAPTVQFIYADGAWVNAPLLIAQQNGGTGEFGDIKTVTTPTTYTLTYEGLPQSTSTYSFVVHVRGI